MRYIAALTILAVALVVRSSSAAQFVQQGDKVKIPGNYVNSVGGVAVSADGNTALVGGSVTSLVSGSVFTRSGGVWSPGTQLSVNTVSVNTGYGTTCLALSADGNTALIGGYGFVDGETPDGHGTSGNFGGAFVFVRNGSGWIQSGGSLISGSGLGIQVASAALSADGKTALVGIPGAPRVFALVANSWVQQATLIGEGYAVALSGDGNTALCGSPNDYDPSNVRVGAAFVFTHNGGIWTQQGGKLVGTGSIPYAQGASPLSVGQGASVSLSGDGNTALIGGPLDNNGTGATWVFARNAGVWTQQSKLVGTGTVVGASNVIASQGSSVSLSGDGALLQGSSDTVRGA